MARSSTTFQPGRSGNPKGRPPKKRALTNLLERGGNRKVDTADGQLAAKRVFVARVWEGLATGRMSFGEGQTIQLDAAEYIALARLLLVQVDGPPKTEVDVTSQGEALRSSPTVDSMADLFQRMQNREHDAPDTGD